MDFMKWLNSLDELLYEVMSWLIFFPLTLWRAIFLPIWTMQEIERQVALPEPEQYGTLLSPPLFLTLALLLAHTVATTLGQTDAIIANRHGLAGLVDDNASALVLRVVVFAAFPLFLAARLVRSSGVALDRTSLRQPFYAQCYPAGVFALGLSVGTSLAIDRHAGANISGIIVISMTVLNFWLMEIRWFAKTLRTGIIRAVFNVMIGLIEGTVFLIIVGFLFTR